MSQRSYRHASSVFSSIEESIVAVGRVNNDSPLVSIPWLCKSEKWCIHTGYFMIEVRIIGECSNRYRYPPRRNADVST